MADSQASGRESWGWCFLLVSGVRTQGGPLPCTGLQVGESGSQLAGVWGWVPTHLAAWPVFPLRQSSDLALCVLGLLGPGTDADRLGMSLDYITLLLLLPVLLWLLSIFGCRKCFLWP